MFDIGVVSLYPWKTAQAITDLMNVFATDLKPAQLLSASGALSNRSASTQEFISFIQTMHTKADAVTIEHNKAILTFPEGKVEMPLKTYNLLRAANADQLAGLLAEYRSHHPDTMVPPPQNPTADSTRKQLSQLNSKLEAYTDTRLHPAIDPIVVRRFLADGSDVPQFPIDDINPLTNEKRQWKDLTFIKASTAAEHATLVTALDEMEAEVRAAAPGTAKAKLYEDMATANLARLDEMERHGVDTNQISGGALVISADKNSDRFFYSSRTHSVTTRTSKAFVFDDDHHKAPLPLSSVLAHEISHSFPGMKNRHEDEERSMHYERMFNSGPGAVNRSVYNMVLNEKETFPGSTLTFGELSKLAQRLRIVDQDIDEESMEKFHEEQRPIIEKLASGFGKTTEEFLAEYNLNRVITQLQSSLSEYQSSILTPPVTLALDPAAVQVPLATPAGAMPVPGGKGK